MPKVSFPINPQENDIFVVNNITYRYSSGKWMNVSIGTVLSSITDYVDSTVASKDNTDEITEGTTNLYYTNARSRAAISGTGAISYNSSTGAITTSQDLTTSGSPTFAGLTLTNNMSITGDIIPTADNVYSLGSASYMWKDVYIGPGSLYVNGQKVIEDNSGTITFSADVGQSLQIATSGAGNIQLSTEPSGVVQISSTLQISSGKNITDSSGIQIGFGDAIQMNSNKIIGLGTPSDNTDAATKGYVDTSISNISTNSISQGNSSVAVNDSGTGSVNITVDGTTALSINSSGIVITGDVTVNGTTTTVNTATLNVSDNIITLNNDVIGTPTQNAGIEVERGDESNVSVRWNESTLVWQFTNDGATYHSIPTTANIRSAISASGSLSYNSSTGAISYTAPTNVSAFTNDAGYITSSDSISGNASTATVATTAGKWTTARTITLGGDLSGSVSIDGSGDVTLTAAVTDDSHNHIIDNVDGLQAALDAKLASASYTASDVLSKVLTVDGAASGLDADLLDGLHESTFMRRTATSELNMSNYNITGVNNIIINDPGPGEGIEWSGGNGWKIYESPDDLSTNSNGNLQIAQNTTRRATFNTSGQLEIPVATGTAPLSVSSTTVVTNLNADLLDGYHIGTSGSTVPLLNGTNTWSNPQTYSNESRYGSYAQKFVQHYGFSSYLNTGEIQRVLKVVLTGSSQNVSIRGTIWIHSSNVSEVFYIDCILRSHTFPDLAWTAFYDVDHMGINNAVKPVLWADETNGQFIFGIEGISNSTHMMDVDLIVLNRGYSYSNFTLFTDTEVAAVDSGYTSYDFTLRREITSNTSATIFGNTLWHAGNDGSGSGLDADLWDGNQFASYLNQPVLTNSAVTFGKINIGTNVYTTTTDLKLSDNAVIGTDASMHFVVEGTNDFKFYNQSADASAGVSSSTLIGTLDETGLVLSGTTLTLNGSQVWHAGNDGSGSGLDADLLDGIDSSSFIRSDADDTATGILTLSGAGSDRLNIYNTTNAGEVGIKFSDNTGQTQAGYFRFRHSDGTSPGSAYGANFEFSTTEPNLAVIIDGAGDYFVGTNKVWNAGNDGTGSGLDADLLDGVQGSAFLRTDGSTVATGIVRFQGNLTLGSDNDVYLYESSAGAFSVRSGSSGAYNYLTFSAAGALTIGGQTVWHSGNDGSGSGLDADLLDGVQGSSFFRSDVADTAIGFFSTTSVNGSGDSGIGIVSGGRLGFDESGVRSWSVKATGGNLVLSSGDDAGELISNIGITADSFTVTGAGGNIAPATGVESWYVTNNISVAAAETEPRDLSFSSDGTKMYVLGNTGNDITQYTLSTAWDVSTASTSTTFSVATQEGTPYGLYFKPDGTKFYVAGTTGDNIYQYACSTAWDVTTASWEKTFSVTGQETDPNAVFFKPDGTKMYVTGSTGDDVNEYDLSTAWDIATATYSTIYNFAAYSTAPQGLSFSSDGTKFWVVGTTYNRIAEFTMSTPWSVATATFSDYVNLYYVQYDENTLYTISGISGLYVNEAQGKAWITDYNTDRVYELTTNTPTTKFTGNKFSIESQLCSIKNSLIINRNLKVHGEIRQLGSAYFGAAYSNTHNATSSSSTLSLGTGNSTGAVNLATGLSSGAFTLGGTATTGIMTLGRSTSAHTLNIDSAGQASGVTKTINIGGSGLSGSITNINIGSSVSGSTGTVNIYSDTAVTGSLTATGEVTAYYSDRRLKENVTVIADPITKVLKLTGICYTPNDLAASFGYNKEEKIVGLFADEVESVLPEAIALAPFDRDEQGNSKSGENYKTVKYEKIVPLLVEAIKQQQDIIDKQNKKIDLLMKHLGLE